MVSQKKRNENMLNEATTKSMEKIKTFIKPNNEVFSALMLFMLNILHGINRDSN